jgi:predicted glutamine amidotransferase
MCQLTLLSSTDIDIRAYLALQLLWNSDIANKDGWGFYNPELNYLYKSELTPNADTNYLTEIAKNKPNTTVIGHVRQTSFNKDTVIKNNSHPFDKKNIVLMHNGTLIRKEGVKPENIIDSEDFANELDKTLEVEPDFYKAITTTYGKYFKGKFAFMVYYKKEDSIYVARGQTSELSYSNIIFTDKKKKEHKLFVVNTIGADIKRTVNSFATFVISTGSFIDLASIDVKEIDRNTLYKFNKETLTLDKVGEFKEEVVNYNVVETGYSRMYRGDDYSDGLEKTVEAYILFGRKLGYLDLTFDEVCALLRIVTGKGICELPLTIKTVNDLSSTVEDFFDTRKVKTWRKIKHTFANKDIFTLYKTLGLEFPYYLNTLQVLDNTLKEITPREQGLLQ